jgi:Leucine Rich repeat
MLTAFSVRKIEDYQSNYERQIVERRDELRQGGGDFAGGQDSCTVYLTVNQLKQWLPRLKEFRGLWGLAITGSPISVEDLKAILEITTLHSLNLSNTDTTDEHLELLQKNPRITVLDLSNTNVTVEGLSKFLLHNGSVRTLALNQMDLTDEQFKKLYSAKVKHWSLTDNKLTDSGLRPVWMNSSLSELDLSRNAISGALFGISPTAKQIELTVDGCALDDQDLQGLLSSVQHITLGKTDLTRAGLELALSCGIGLTLREDSFSENELAKIDPLAVGCRGLRLDGSSFTGGFLENWSSMPRSLDLSYTSVADEELLRLAEKNWRLAGYLNLNHTPITDACLPALGKLKPDSLYLDNTNLSAEGLAGLKLENTTLVVGHGQYTQEQLRLLRKNFKAVHLLTYPLTKRY